MRFNVSGSSWGLGGGFIKLLDTEEEVEDAGEALADEHDWARATGGVDVVFFAGLDGADEERILIPLAFVLTELIGNGEGDRLLLDHDEVDEDEDIFSI